MSKYLICEDVYEDYGTIYISTEENVEKNDLVVYMDYERPSLAKEIQKAKLVKLMKEQMEIQKLEDTLKKNNECNEEMAKLFAQHKELNE